MSEIKEENFEEFFSRIVNDPQNSKFHQDILIQSRQQMASQWARLREAHAMRELELACYMVPNNYKMPKEVEMRPHIKEANETMLEKMAKGK